MNTSVKVSEAIQVMDPDIRATIEGMMARDNAHQEITVDQLISGSKPTTGEERFAILSLMNWGSNKFAPKLSFPKRCEILALYRAGLTRETLAMMYNVDRRTITHIYNPVSPHYKNVREEELRLGRERFRAIYLSEDVWNQAMALGKERVNNVANNKYAKGKAGIHVVRGTFCEYEHRVMIEWREKDENIEVAGWHYKDLDGDFPDNWFFAGEESRKTSMACYLAMMKDITDKIA